MSFCSLTDKCTTSHNLVHAITSEQISVLLPNSHQSCDGELVIPIHYKPPWPWPPRTFCNFTDKHTPLHNLVCTVMSGKISASTFPPTMHHHKLITFIQYDPWSWPSRSFCTFIDNHTPYMHSVHQITLGWYKYLFMKYWPRAFERTSALVL